MRIRVETKTDALAALYTGLTSIASGETARQINREIAGELQARVQSQFDRGVDPYGSRWPAPKDGGKPGVRSGKLKGTVQVIARGPRILLSAVGVTYAGFFNYGTRKMAARPIFPERSIGLPPAWKAIIENAVKRNVSRKLRAR